MQWLWALLMLMIQWKCIPCESVLFSVNFPGGGKQRQWDAGRMVGGALLKLLFRLCSWVPFLLGGLLCSTISHCHSEVPVILLEKREKLL